MIDKENVFFVRIDGNKVKRRRGDSPITATLASPTVIIARSDGGFNGVSVSVSEDGNLTIGVGGTNSRVIIYDGPFPDENPEITPELFAALVRRSLDG